MALLQSFNGHAAMVTQLWCCYSPSDGRICYRHTEQNRDSILLSLEYVNVRARGKMPPQVNKSSQSRVPEELARITEPLDHRYGGSSKASKIWKSSGFAVRIAVTPEDRYAAAICVSMIRFLPSLNASIHKRACSKDSAD
jgi:hypothetical protein